MIQKPGHIYSTAVRSEWKTIVTQLSLNRCRLTLLTNLERLSVAGCDQINDTEENDFKPERMKYRPLAG